MFNSRRLAIVFLVTISAITSAWIDPAISAEPLCVPLALPVLLSDSSRTVIRQHRLTFVTIPPARSLRLIPQRHWPSQWHAANHPSAVTETG
jgi:hypothetical protein